MGGIDLIYIAPPFNSGHDYNMGYAYYVLWHGHTIKEIECYHKAAELGNEYD